MTARLLSVVSFVACLLLASPEARACKCAAPVIQQSAPRAAEQDVALDVAPLLFLSGTVSPQTTISWSTLDGESVAFEQRTGAGPRSCRGVVELVPQQLLRANTEYEISVEGYRQASGEGRRILRFTTGAKVVSDEPSMPSGHVRVVRAGTARSSCGTGDEACAYFGPKMIELLVPGTPREQFWAFAEGTAPFTLPIGTECVEVRTRNLAGARSDPLRLCGDDLNARDAGETERHWGGLDCEQEEAASMTDTKAEPEPEGNEVIEDGCAVGAMPHHSANTLLVATLGLMLRAWRRRRSPR